MTEVYSQLFAQGGAPLPGLTVDARLMASSKWLSDRTGQVIDEANSVTDDTGTWLLDLTPTGAFEDSGAFYLILDGQGQHPITVPDTGGPYRMRDLLLQAPGPSDAPTDALISPDAYNSLVLHANGLYAYVPVWFGRVGDPTPDVPSPTLAIRS